MSHAHVGWSAFSPVGVCDVGASVRCTHVMCGMCVHMHVVHPHACVMCTCVMCMYVCMCVMCAHACVVCVRDVHVCDVCACVCVMYRLVQAPSGFRREAGASVGQRVPFLQQALHPWARCGGDRGPTPAPLPSSWRPLKALPCSF